MRKLGNICILLGIVMLLGAAGLLAWNQMEDAQAGAQAAQIVAQLQEYSGITGAGVIDRINSVPDPYDPMMTEVEIDGNKYIGYLRLPNMENLLPVMSDWTYPQLQIAPCRYHGSSKTDDLVIMAHNYPKHFGKLGELKPGEIVYFLDMDDIVSKYEVVATEVLNEMAVEDMTAGAYDLTLFTCTYGGKSRMAVRCDRVSD